MSLVVKNKNIKRLDKPIKCYEIVLRRFPKGRGYSNPVYSLPYCGGAIEKAIMSGYTPMRKDSEFIHSYKNYEDAFVVSADMNKSVIYECEIPSCSSYYEEVSSDGFESYMSKSVRFIRKCV